MAVRRPLVISGQFLHEADDTDGQVILGSITYGSGLGEELDDYADDFTANVLLTPQTSGLLLVAQGSDYKLALDGATEDEADRALVSGNLALSEVAPAFASGTEAQRISVEALASGNDALLANLSGLQLSDSAIILNTTALASGNASLEEASSSLSNAVNAIISGDFAYGSGVAANSDSVEALASGNAALSLLKSSPFLSEGDLIGLVFALG